MVLHMLPPNNAQVRKTGILPRAPPRPRKLKKDANKLPGISSTAAPFFDFNSNDPNHRRNKSKYYLNPATNHVVPSLAVGAGYINRPAGAGGASTGMVTPASSTSSMASSGWNTLPTLWTDNSVSRGTNQMLNRPVGVERVGAAQPITLPGIIPTARVFNIDANDVRQSTGGQTAVRIAPDRSFAVATTPTPEMPSLDIVQFSNVNNVSSRGTKRRANSVSEQTETRRTRANPKGKNMALVRRGDTVIDGPVTRRQKFLPAGKNTALVRRADTLAVQPVTKRSKPNASGKNMNLVRKADTLAVQPVTQRQRPNASGKNMTLVRKPETAAIQPVTRRQRRN